MKPWNVRPLPVLDSFVKFEGTIYMVAALAPECDGAWLVDATGACLLWSDNERSDGKYLADWVAVKPYQKEEILRQVKRWRKRREP